MTTKTNFIIICEKAFLTPGSNNLNLTGIFTQINGERFPLKYPAFFLVANFDIDTLGSHEFRTTITDATGKQAGETRATMNILSSPFQVIMGFQNVVFAVPGSYTFRLFVGDIEIGSRTLQVAPILRQKPSIA